MLIGHQKIWKFFSESLKDSSLSHAYLFSGEDKIGKKTTALEISKLLNCLNLGDNNFYKKYPCLKCRNCLDIGKNQFPDLFFLEKDRDKKEINITKIRSLKKYLSFKPYNSPFKIAIIDDAHLMNISAQNALLKTAEEPTGPKTIIFLITNKSQQLLKTIISRVQEVRFFKPSNEEIDNYFLTANISDKEKEAIKKFSFNKPGIIIDFINYPKKLEDHKFKIQKLKEIIDSPLYIRFNYIKELVDNSSDEEILETLALWTSYFKELLLIDVNRIKKIKILKAINRTYYLILKTNVNKKLILENLVLEF